MSYVGIGVEKFEVVVTVGDGRKDLSHSLTPGAARRVAIKILEAIGEAEHRAGVKILETEAERQEGDSGSASILV